IADEHLPSFVDSRRTGEDHLREQPPELVWGQVVAEDVECVLACAGGEGGQVAPPTHRVEFLGQPRREHTLWIEKEAAGPLRMSKQRREQVLEIVRPASSGAAKDQVG